MAAEKQVSVRIVSHGGDQLHAQLVSIGQDGSKALQDVDRASKRMSGSVQNAGYQVQDFFVQVAAGTDPMRALSMQLPQLLGGMGLMGILAGTAVAAISVLGPAFLGASADAENLQERMSGFDSAINAYNAAIETAAMKTADLTAKFGGFSGQIKGFSEYMASVQLGATVDEVQASIDPLKAGLVEIQTAMVNVANAKAFVESVDATAEPEIHLRAIEALEIYQDSLDRAAEKMGILPEQADQLAQTLDQLGEAQTMREIAAAAGDALAYIAAIVPEGQAMEPALRDATAALYEMQQSAAEAAAAAGDLASAGPGSGWMAPAIGETNALISRLIVAKQIADGLQSVKTAGLAEQYAQYGEGRVAGENLARNASDLYGGDGNVLRDLNYYKPAHSGRGGGGGRQSAVNDATREAQRIYEQTRTEAEKYAEEQVRLNELLAGGYISQDTYNRALTDLKDELGSVSDIAKDMRSDFKSAFSDMVTGAASAKEAVSDMLASIASHLADSAFDMLWGALFPSAGSGGGLLSGLFGGGRATGGPVKGGTAYMVGEAGPEMFVPASAGHIMPNAGTSAGGNVTIHLAIDARGAQNGVADQIATEIAKLMPTIETRVISAVQRRRRQGK